MYLLCTIHVFEPVIGFADKIERRFARNEKIFVHRFRLSSENQIVQISVNRDSSSLYKPGNDVRDARLVRAVDFMREDRIEKIDLMKINIEGGEYNFLEHLIDFGFVKTLETSRFSFMTLFLMLRKGW